MRQLIYERFDKIGQQSQGYITTKALLEGGLTNRQISALLKEGYLEKIANGYFWIARSDFIKPKDYKAIEVCLINPEAVIAADSACYYHGLIDVEPERLSVCTRRDDRHQMNFSFRTTRHYLSEKYFNRDKERKETGYGNYQIYSVDRSVCDCIRFRESIDEDIFSLVIERYKKEDWELHRQERMLAYAKHMKFENEIKKYIH